jgi:hypothetical protein
MKYGRVKSYGRNGLGRGPTRTNDWRALIEFGHRVRAERQQRRLFDAASEPDSAGIVAAGQNILSPSTDVQAHRMDGKAEP